MKFLSKSIFSGFIIGLVLGLALSAFIYFSTRIRIKEENINPGTAASILCSADMASFYAPILSSFLGITLGAGVVLGISSFRFIIRKMKRLPEKSSIKQLRRRARSGINWLYVVLGKREKVMSELLKAILYSVGAWIVTLGLSFILPIPIISGFAGLLSALVGFVLLILALISLIKDKDKISSLLAMVLVMATTWLAITRAFDWGSWVHFQLNRGRYEAKVAELLSAQDEAERERICGDECWVMSADSKRIAFHYVHGFLNWHDFVYDPSGAVMEQEYEKKKQINGYLVGAEHLSGNWYLVHFGD